MNYSSFACLDEEERPPLKICGFSGRGGYKVENPDGFSARSATKSPIPDWNYGKPLR